MKRRANRQKIEPVPKKVKIFVAVYLTLVALCIILFFINYVLR